MQDCAKHLYCFGGWNDSDGPLSAVSRLNFTTERWESLAPMPTPRYHFGAAVLGTKVYLCGGRTMGKTIASVEVYDCLTNTWDSSLPPLPEPRQNCAAAEIGGYIYVAGGKDASQQPLLSMIRYDPRKNRWEPLAKLWGISYDHQLLSLNGYLYAICGLQTRTLLRYDPRENQWICLQDTHQPHLYPGGTVHNGEIFVTDNNGMESYSLENDSWTKHDAVLRCNGRLFSYDDKLWVIDDGEGGTAKKVGVVYILDPVLARKSNVIKMDIVRKFHCSFVL